MSRHLIIAPLSLLVVMVLYLVMHGMLNQRQSVKFKENESEYVFSPFAVEEKVRTIYCGRGLYRKPLTKAELWKETYKVIFSTLSSACFSSPYENLRLSTPNIQHISQGILKELIPNDPFTAFERNKTNPKPPYNQKLALSWLPPVQYPLHTTASEGWVELEILVNAQGTVDDIHVISANPPRVFDRTAIQTYKKAKFLPEIVNGKAIAKTIIQRIDFKLAED